MTVREGRGQGDVSTGISIIIPALDAAASLHRTLARLGVAGDRPAVHEIIVVDGGSRDATRDIARAGGARVIPSLAGRGRQLAAGAAAARGEWLLFLHADTALDPDWSLHVERFIGAPDNRDRAAVFRFALDDDAPAARRLERIVAWRVARLGLPYGDQGLLIARELYHRIGGFAPLPLMEDVDLIRRVGRDRLVVLECRAVTSAARYARHGYFVRSLRNLLCLGLYFGGVPPRMIIRLYG